MKRTIYDVTVEELEFLVNWETKGPVPAKVQKLLFNNFVSKITLYEQENENVLVSLYHEDYREIYDQIAIVKDQEKMIDIIIDYPWEEATFAIVMGTQMFHVWSTTLTAMTPMNMRASFGAALSYVRLGVGEDLLGRPPTEKHGINIGQALCWSNAMAIINTAIVVAIGKKKKGGV